MRVLTLLHKGHLYSLHQKADFDLWFNVVIVIVCAVVHVCNTLNIISVNHMVQPIGPTVEKICTYIVTSIRAKEFTYIFH